MAGSAAFAALTGVLLVGVLGLVVTDLVFTILIYNGQSSDLPKRVDGKPIYKGPVGNSSGFKDAAAVLLRGLNRSADPCEDFHQFVCGQYIADMELPDGVGRIGTFDEADDIVNTVVSIALDKMVPTTASETETYEMCLQNSREQEGDKAKVVNNQLEKDIGGLPMLKKDWKKKDVKELLQVAGRWEKNWGITALMSNLVTANEGKRNSHALHVNRPSMPLPIDFYIKPSYLNKLQQHLDKVIELLQLFAKSIDADDQNVKDQAEKLVQFEVQLAMIMMPNDLLKNIHLLYNPYTVKRFGIAYPSIGDDYFRNLLEEIVKGADIDGIDLIIQQPRYFRALNGMFSDPDFDTTDLANYLGYRYILENREFIGGKTQSIIRSIERSVADPRKDDEDPIEQKLECVSVAKELIPYGVGYVYVKNLNPSIRAKTVADVYQQINYVVAEFIKNVNTMEWMSSSSKREVKRKADDLLKNVGYPDWFDFDDPSRVDRYHVNYRGLGSITDYYTLLGELTKARQLTENLGLLNLDDVDRYNFLASPAEVNAWYEPVLNAITIPFGILNPPFYRHDFPVAFNYAGTAGTVGHELIHGFDTEGVQYNGTGQLGKCDFQYCTWLDRESTLGFVDMAQCVISQYSEKCCPLKTGNVHCANGDATSGENIADLGGQLAAYNAYRTFIAKERKGVEEDRLPGLEEFTPNQIFWMAYGFTWCAKMSDESLANQLLTNVHAPGACRVNQVVQDIPAFAADFECQRGTSMFPREEERCKRLSVFNSAFPMIAGAAAHARIYAKRTPVTASPRKLRKNGPQTPKKQNRHGSLGALTIGPNSSADIPTSSRPHLQVPTAPGSPLLGRKRAGSVPVAKFTLAVAWGLKTDYVRAVKVTWARLCDVPRSTCRGILGIMERVFEKFDSKDKHVREVFYQAAFVDSMADCHGRRHSDNSIATLRDHIHFFVSLISQVVNSLETAPTDIFEHIDKIGSYHYHMRKYGFRAQMWDKLGVCLIDAIVVQDCVRGFPEACKAWTVLIAALIDRLRSAKKNFGFPVSLRGPPSLPKNIPILNSISVTRCTSPHSERRRSPTASPIRTPNPLRTVL